MTDKIAEIKERHECDESWRADGYDPVVGRLPQSHDDRGYLLAEVERLRAGWMPIESAPRDGAWILLWDQRRAVAVSGCWHDEPERNSPNGYEPGWSWWSADDDLMIWDGDDAPTYWMPLPPPPKEGAP